MDEGLAQTLGELVAVGRSLEAMASIEAARELFDRIEQKRKEALAERLPAAVHNAFAEISLRAARRCGQLLAEANLSRGGRPPKDCRSPKVYTLGALRITKNRSSRWQRLAAIPQEVFEAYLRQCRTNNDTPSGARLLSITGKLHRRSALSPESPDTSKTRRHSSNQSQSDMTNLRDHLGHLSELLRSPRAASETTAKAVDRRILSVIGDMQQIVDRLESA